MNCTKRELNLFFLTKITDNDSDLLRFCSEMQLIPHGVNIVDVQIMIPSLNLHALEHFCYRYMSRCTGEPQVVVPRLLRQGLA